jgi:hypothetical protein
MTKSKNPENKPEEVWTIGDCKNSQRQREYMFVIRHVFGEIMLGQRIDLPLLQSNSSNSLVTKA